METSFSEQINLAIASIVGIAYFSVDESLTLQNAIFEYVSSIYDIIVEYLNPFQVFLCSIHNVFCKLILKNFSLALDGYGRTIIFKDGEQIGMTKLLYKKRKGL